MEPLLCLYQTDESFVDPPTASFGVFIGASRDPGVWLAAGVEWVGIQARRGAEGVRRDSRVSVSSLPPSLPSVLPSTQHTYSNHTNHARATHTGRGTKRPPRRKQRNKHHAPALARAAEESTPAPYIPLQHPGLRGTSVQRPKFGPSSRPTPAAL